MEEITKYFNAEKQESVVFVLTGLLATILSLYFLFKIKQPFYNGMAYALIAIALIQITVGSTIYIRSPKDMARVKQMVQTDKASLQTEEIPRMQNVMKSFVLYRRIEIALIVAGLTMFLYFQAATPWKGAGLGLAIQAGIMLVLDLFAENRGAAYLEHLKNLV